MLLRPGGVLTIAVPNDVLAWTSTLKSWEKNLGLSHSRNSARSWESPRREVRVRYIFPTFTPAVLRRLLESSGFAILEESLDPYYASAGLLRAADALYFVSHRVLLATLKINRYDTIWLVCHKPGTANHS